MKNLNDNKRNEVIMSNAVMNTRNTENFRMCAVK